MPKLLSKVIRPIGLQDCLVLVGLISVLCIQMNEFAVDPGVGWHIKSGKLILSEGSFITHDPFLASKTPRAWLAEQWLGSLMLYSLHSQSWALSYAVLAALYLFTYLALLYKGVSKYCGYCIPASFATVLAFKLGHIHFIFRPVIFNFFFFTIVYLACFRLYQTFRENKKIAFGDIWKYILGCFLIFVVWANTHPCFVFGLILLAALPIGLVLDNIFLKPGKQVVSSGILKSSLLFVIAAAATLINPYGFRLLENIFWTSSSNFVAHFYEEWQSPDFGAFQGLVFEIPIVIMIACLLVGRKINWGFFEFIIMISFGHFTLLAVRNLPFFGIVIAIPLAEALTGVKKAEFVERSKIFKRLARAFVFVEKREKRSYRGYPLLLIAIASLILGATITGRLFLFKGTFGPSENKYPYRAVRMINDLAGKRKSVTVINYMGWGGFITLMGRKNVKPIIDDRTALLGEEFYKEYFSAMKPGGSWKEYTREKKGDLLLLKTDSDLVRLIRSEGTLEILHEDKIAVLIDTCGLYQDSCDKPSDNLLK